MRYLLLLLLPSVVLAQGFSPIGSARGRRTCSYVSIANPVVDGGTIIELPPAPGQVGVRVTAHDFGSQVDFVSCWPSSTPDGGPLPNCITGGVGYPVHDHDSLTLEISSTNRVRCIACAHGNSPAQSTAVLSGGVYACTP